MKLFRKIIFWLHLIAGTVAGIVILIMSVTGALLAFQPQIEWFAEREARVVQTPAADANRLDAASLLGKVLAQKPELKPSGITIYADKTAAATVAVGRENTVFVNPYTGEITGESSKSARGFFHEVTDWHRWLAASGEYRAVGKAVTGWSNLAFLFLAISGVYLWFPRKLTWQHLKPVTFFKWNLAGRARDFNWHNSIGFWSSLVLIILTATGVVISFQWAGNLVYYATGNQPPQQQQQQRPPQPPNEQQNAQPFVAPANLAALFARAEQQSEGWKSIAVRFPIGKEAVFTIDEGKSLNVFGRSNLTLNPETAEVVKWEPYNELNAGRQLRSWMRFTHTGESFGVVGQTIAFLACLGGAVLVWTGFSLAWRRFRGWLAKRAGKTQAEI